MRIAHISDLHYWHITFHPARLWGKRLLGMANLIANRARAYRRESLAPLLAHVDDMRADHILVTGDLTATSLDQEFRDVRSALDGADASRLTVIPGNHDRYTRPHSRLFEHYFGEFAPRPEYPWLKVLPSGHAILGLDPTHPNVLSATGTITQAQLEKARILLQTVTAEARRLLVACHYPVALPAGVFEERGHGLRGAQQLRAFLASAQPVLYCHGHIHMAWSFLPESLPRTLCLNAGAALRTRNTTRVSAGLLEILLEGDGVEVRRHRLRGGKWEVNTLSSIPDFFARGAGNAARNHGQ